MAAFQLNGKYYDPALEQLGDGLSPATAYGMAGGKWRTNIYRLFTDLLAQIAALVVGTINASDIFGHEIPSSATSIALTNSNKRSQAVTMTAAGQAVRMPDATTLAKGEVWRMRNAGGTHAWALQDSAGGVLVASVAAGEEVSLQLEANGTAAGTWRVLETVLGRKLALPATVPAARAILGLDGFHARNYIVNGGMQVDQRNEGASQAFTAGAALAYCVDRWYGFCTGANVTGQRVAGSGRARHRYQFTGAASVTGIGFGTRLEARRAYPLNGQPATLSVDLANSLLTTVTWTAYYASTADAFGTLASPTRTQIATGSFTVDATVSRYSAPISIPAAATTGIEVVFTVGAQVSGAWTIGDVQLEEGATATPFERVAFDDALAACKRFYEKTFNDGVKPAQNAGSGGSVESLQQAASQPNLAMWNFMAEKRATGGTYTFFNPGAANASARDLTSGSDIGAVTLQDQGTKRVALTWGNAAAAGNRSGVNATYDCEL